MADVLLKEYDNAPNCLGEVRHVKEVLHMEVMHYKGEYRLHVIQQKHEGGFVSFEAFKDGNFTARVYSGRKSKKKLDTFNDFIINNKGALFSLWNNKDYAKMVDKVIEVSVGFIFN